MSHLRFEGGQELNLLDICRTLSKRGHSITLLYVKEGDLPAVPKFSANNKY